MTILFNKIKLKPIRRKLRSNSTPCEVLLWTEIRREKLDVKFRRQYSVGKFVLDFYCPKLKLALEVDGFHHQKKDVKAYDKTRQKFLESLGVRIIRINNNEIQDNLDCVLNRIKNAIIKT